jgi:hypothetical protein
MSMADEPFGLPGQRSREPRRARRTGVVVGVMAVAVLVMAAVAAGAYAYATAPSAGAHTPTYGANTHDPVVTLAIHHAGSLAAGKAHVSVDGAAVPDVRVASGVVRAALPGLADGTHDVEVRTDPLGLLGRRIDVHWNLVVDTKPPALRVASPLIIQPAARASTAAAATPAAPAVSADAVTSTAPTPAPATAPSPFPQRPYARSDQRVTRFRIRTEQGAHVSVTSIKNPAATGTATAGASGEADVSVALAEGRQAVRIQVRDRVGNVTGKRMLVVVDSIAPKVSFDTAQVLKSNVLAPVISASDASGYASHFTVDGLTSDVTIRPLTAAPGRSTPAISSAAPLAEGVHTLSFTATDPFGHATTVTRTVLVNSSETLGDDVVGRGAVGADVHQLQDLLRGLGLFTPGGPGTPSHRDWTQERYGKATAAAVCRYQNDHQIKADCIVGSDTLTAMTLKIVVNRTTHTLTLYRLGKVEKTYSVAVGQAMYPTPTGHFHIVDMQKDPTWTPPPDAVWAKGAKPIGPGPGNPLGTRWMGLDTPGVGIHGTDEPASIGYSLSHGCIRMRIPDAEDLFSRVQVGTPVDIID